MKIKIRRRIRRKRKIKSRMEIGVAQVFCLIWLGVVGAVDDWLKLTVGRREGSRHGLTSREKLLFQIGLGILLAYFTWHYRNEYQSTSLFFPLFKTLRIPLNLGFFVFIA